MVGNRNLVIDLIGVLLALVAGISGQLILSDPLHFLFRTSELPLISPEDLPGSQVSRELEIIGGRPWSNQREFGQSMVLIRNEMMIVETDQYIVWFADPTQAVAASKSESKCRVRRPPDHRRSPWVSLR